MPDRLSDSLCAMVWGSARLSLRDEIANDSSFATALAARAFEEKLVPQLIQFAGDVLPTNARKACSAILSRQQTWCDRVLDALPDGCVVAKGPTVAWDDPSLGLRQFADIDIFVPTVEDAARLVPALERIGLTRRPTSHVAFRPSSQTQRCASFRFMPEKHLPGFGGVEMQIGGFPITDTQSFDGAWLWANSVPWHQGMVELRRLNDFALFCLELSNFVYHNKRVLLRDLIDIKALAPRVPADCLLELRQLVARHGLSVASQKFHDAFAAVDRTAELPDLVRSLSTRTWTTEPDRTQRRSGTGVAAWSALRNPSRPTFSNVVSELKRIAHSSDGHAWLRRAIRFILARRLCISTFRWLGVVLLHHEARNEGLAYLLEAGLQRPIPGCLTIISIDPPT